MTVATGGTPNGSTGAAPAGVPSNAGAGATPPTPPANAADSAPVAAPAVAGGAPAATTGAGAPPGQPAAAGEAGATPPQAAAPDWRERRIAALSARLKETTAENERLRAQSQSNGAPGAPAAPVVAPAPAATPGSVEWTRAVQTEAQRVAEIARWNSECNNVAVTGRAAFGEAQFNGAVASLMQLVDAQDPQSLLAYNGFLTAAMASGNAPQIIMEMAQDLNQAARMMALSPVQQVAEYTRRVMQAQGAAAGGENTGGAAGATGVLPGPITPIGGRGAQHTVIDPADPARASNLSSADWHARRRIQAEERAKQRGGFR